MIITLKLLESFHMDISYRTIFGMHVYPSLTGATVTNEPRSLPEVTSLELNHR